MTYQINPTSYRVLNSDPVDAPATARYVLCSVWILPALAPNGFTVGNLAFPGPGFAGVQIATGGGPASTATIQFGDGIEHSGHPSQTLSMTYPNIAVGTWVNAIFSIDTIGQVYQLYVNDAAQTVSGPVPQAIFIANPGDVATIPSGFFSALGGCQADFYFDFPDSFYDLSVTANRRKFISGSGFPVDLGADGDGPTGSPPAVYHSVRASTSDPSVYLENSGLGGGTFTTPDPIQFCASGSYPVPTLSGDANMADVWFSPTPSFFDLTLTENRRKFISAAGAPVYLGGGGDIPIAGANAVFFSRIGDADSFATNRGSGGPFQLIGGDLTDAPTAPPCDTQSITTLGPATLGIGVLGDYRNGNLYAFDLDTLTDDGTQRRWLRRWRALPQPADKTIRFGSLRIDMESGSEVPPDTNPQMVIRWSDDGGYTWSNPRIVAVGRVGQTGQNVRVTRLGSTRRFARSDRIFEISSTDEFKVAIVGAVLDT